MRIYHIVLPEVWAQFKDKDFYAAESLETENFIHCSFAEQIETVLQRYYKGAEAVLILEIEPEKLTSKLVCEPSTNGEIYPHIYGAINRDAIVGVEKKYQFEMRENFAEVVKPDSAEAEQLAAIDFARLPAHVAIIMDGNGRWAKRRGEQRVFGHRAGVESVRAIVDTSARLGLQAVTLYAFSTENWKRPKLEVAALMQMLKHYLKSELNEINRQNIRFQAIGKIEDLDKSVQNEIGRATEKTANNSGTVLSVALNYGGRAEIVEAAKKAFENLRRGGKSIDDLTESDIEENLYTRGLPEVDLLVRTSGEFRISNFLLWQLAYSEIYVTETLFPDFRRGEIFKAILDFQKRERRFGGI